MNSRYHATALPGGNTDNLTALRAFAVTGRDRRLRDRGVA